MEDEPNNALKPWPPSEATQRINRCAGIDELDLRYTEHAKQRMLERDLLVGDLTHVLKFGSVFAEAEPASRQGFYKYKIECTTPNSNGRRVRLVVIPSPNSCSIKIVTVMWVSEK